jgi:hypothetical protein
MSLKLGVGDRVPGDLECGQARVLGILVDEVLRARDTHPVDVRQPVRTQTHAGAKIQPQPAHGTADGGSGAGLGRAGGVGHERHPLR